MKTTKTYLIQFLKKGAWVDFAEFDKEEWAISLFSNPLIISGKRFNETRIICREVAETELYRITKEPEK